MDMVAFLRYVFDHNQQVIAGLVVVILVTAILLFLRAIGQEKSETVSRSAGPALDIGAIETALRKVMAAQSGSVSGFAANPQASSASAGTSAGWSPSTSDRDIKIQELAREIDRLTLELAAKADSAPGVTKAGIDPAKFAELQSKIDELQGKLSEYEIIEDDIADLSRFKEENAELRSELELLKKSGGVSAARGPVELNDELESLFNAPETKTDAPTAAIKTAAPAFEPELIAIPIEPDPTDIELKQLASSLDLQTDANPTFEDTLDTDKMLAEVAGLSEGTEGDVDALDGSLDTDKMLAEVASLGGAAAAPASVPARTPVPPPAVSQASADVPEPTYEDDLLAEFKETNDGGQG